jgi:hypothetical protein
MVKDSIEQLFLCLQVFFKLYGTLSLDVFENNLLVCEQSFPEGIGAAKDLAADLKKMTVEGIKFALGVTEDELANLLKVLTLKPDIVKARGGMKTIFAQENITHVVLTEVRYTRIKEEEEVVKKEEKEEPSAGAASAPESESAPESGKDIVGMVSDFFGGKSDVVPEKEVIAYEFKKHSRKLVKQLLKLIGPEKAVDEVLKIIEERFAKAGFSPEEKKCMSKN